MGKEPTKRQRQILDYIARRLRDEGFPPTLQEIADRFGIASPNGVRDHLLALERKGLLRRRPDKSRALSLDPAAVAPPGRPLLGSVPAGGPVLSEENFEGYLDLNEYFGRGEGSFLLRVRGESMAGAGIRDGVVRRL